MADSRATGTAWGEEARLEPRGLQGGWAAGCAGKTLPLECVLGPGRL